MAANHHVQKPTFMNQISTGNVLSALGLALTGSIAIGGVWMSLNNQVAAAQAHIQALDTKIVETRDNIERRQDRTEARIEKALEQVNAKLDRLIERSN